MSNSISRRNFLKGTAGLTTVGLLSACAPKIAATPAVEASASEAPVELLTADETIETDVAVVGIGCTGIMAAAGAADKGKKVVAIDALHSLSSGNCVNTTAIWAVESTPEKQFEGYVTQKEAFLHLIQGTNYQSNGEVLRNMIANSGRAMDLLINEGVPFDYVFAMPGANESNNFMIRGGHAFHTYGEERGAIYQGLLDKRGVVCKYDTTALALIKENDKVVGVQCKDSEGKIIDIMAQAVIVCTGGFIANKEMVTEKFAGAKVLGLGSLTCKGDGIKMSQVAGAQIGKNFSITLNEFGSANEKGSSKFAYIPGKMEFNSVFQLPIFGSILVDNQGNRFMDEGKMVEETMFTSEPCLRLGKYYIVVDKAYLDTIAKTPVLDLIPSADKMVPLLATALQGVVLSDIYTDFDKAITEGWAFKADTIDELASMVKMPNLSTTLKDYNQYCMDKDDTQFYKDMKYLTAIETGPYYIAEYQTSAWATFGGIKTDYKCQAVTAEGQIIPGLFIAGTDADLWSVPYYQGGSAQGFCIASGLIAGEAAAESAS